MLKRIRLFDRRGSIYSSRPESFIGNQLICPNETHILLVPYGQGWRKLRKACQSLLNVNEVDSLLPIQNAEASQTMLETPPEPWKLLSPYTSIFHRGHPGIRVRSARSKIRISQGAGIVSCSGTVHRDPRSWRYASS